MPQYHKESKNGLWEICCYKMWNGLIMQSFFSSSNDRSLPSSASHLEEHAQALQFQCRSLTVCFRSLCNQSQSPRFFVMWKLVRLIISASFKVTFSFNILQHDPVVPSCLFRFSGVIFAQSVPLHTCVYQCRIPATVTIETSAPGTSRAERVEFISDGGFSCEKTRLREKAPFTQSD